MSKHHHQSREEQIIHRIHDAAQAQQDEIHYQKNAAGKLEDIQKKKESKNEIKADTKKLS